MTYHTWNDDWPYWEELYKAESYIVKWTYRLSLCHLSSKEKYGTIRYEYIFPPGGRRYKTPIIDAFLKLFGEVNYDGHKYQKYMWGNSYLYNVWIKFGKYILKKVVNRATKKFPNVKEEILEDLDWFD